MDGIIRDFPFYRIDLGKTNKYTFSYNYFRFLSYNCFDKVEILVIVLQKFTIILCCKLWSIH